VSLHWPIVIAKMTATVTTMGSCTCLWSLGIATKDWKHPFYSYTTKEDKTRQNS